MNKKIILAILAIGMLILLPYNGVAEKDFVDREMELNIRENIHNQFIDEFGEKKYIELHNNVVTSICNWFYEYTVYNYDADGYIEVVIKERLTAQGLEVMEYPDWLEEILWKLIAWCESFAEMCYLMFGHGQLGQSTAFILCCLAMFIPCRLLTIPLYFSEGFFQALYIDFLELIDAIFVNYPLDELFYMYGIFGVILALLVLSPVLIILSPIILFVIIFFIPISRFMATWDLIIAIVGNVFTDIT